MSCTISAEERGMHGIVLAAGEGKRLRPITFSIPKPLIPLLGRPILAYGLDQLKSIGATNVTLVVGWLGFVFKERLGYGDSFGVKLSYVVQERRLGIAHAISLALTNNNIHEDFIVYLGDNIIHEEWVSKFKKLIEEQEYDLIVFLNKVSDPRRFGVAVFENGRLKGFVEKPKHPPSQYALVGLYYFREPKEFLRCFSTLKPSKRGEYEITDIINCYIKNQKRIGIITIERWWKDAGKPEDLIEAMMMLMDVYLKEQKIEGSVEGEVVGNVYVGKNSVVEGKVYGPAYIGEGVIVAKNSVVEHYVNIERGSEILQGSISRSLILEESILDLGSSRMTDSVIGMRSRIAVSKNLRSYLRIVVSENSRLELI